MVNAERRWLLAIVTSVVLAVTMLLSPTAVLAKDVSADPGEGPQVTDQAYKFVNSDGQEVEAYKSNDGFVYSVVNSDGTAENPNYVAKIYGNVNASASTKKIDIPNTLSDYPVVSVAMDPRYPVADESYDFVTEMSIPANMTRHHYFRFFENLKALTVDPDNPVFHNRTDGIKDGVMYYCYTGKDEEEGEEWTECGVEVYPRGKTDKVWVMPDNVTDRYEFYKGCPLEEVTIGKSVRWVWAKSFRKLEKVKAVHVAEGNKDLYSKDGVLFYNDVWEEEDGEGQEITITKSYLEYYPAARAGAEYVVPEGIQRLDIMAFYNNLALTKLTFPKSLERIYTDFEGCENLATFEFTWEEAPGEDEFTNFEDLATFVQHHNVDILYPAGGKNYEPFIKYLKRGGRPDIPEKSEAIALNEKKNVEIVNEGETVTFAFTPKKDGSYCFFSDGDYDTKGFVQTDDELIASNDDNDYASGENFAAYFSGKAGTKYYLQAKMYSKTETGAFTVSVEERILPEGAYEPISADVEKIKLNEEKKVEMDESVGKKVVTYAFTPDKDGTYCFNSTSSSEGFDPDGCVLTVERAISKDGSYSDFEVIFDATAGTTYYLQAKIYNEDEIDGSVSLKVVEYAPAEHEHTWGKVQYIWAIDDSSVTATHYCTVKGCKESETETVGVTSSVISEATCTEAGKMRLRTKGFTNKAFKTQTKVVAIPPEHALKQTKATKATATKEGNTEYWTCSNCGKYFADAEGKTEIKAGSWIIAKDLVNVKAKTVKAKSNKKTKIKAKDAFTVSYADGRTVKYKKTKGDKKITVSKGGVVTVKKGLKKKNTYLVNVTATVAGNDKYAQVTKKLTLKVKIK